MKLHVLIAALFLLLPLTVPAAATTQQSPSDVVRLTVDGVLERLAAERQQLERHPERIYEMINELVIPRFDFSSMSRWVLGASWKQASAAQRQVFIEQFKTLLVRTYAKALLEYSDEAIRYLDTVSREDSRLVTVNTEMQSAGGAVPLSYRMHMADGQWKVIDVSVDGISLVSTYRGSFRSEIRKNGLDSLIAKLSERNERLAASLQTE